MIDKIIDIAGKIAICVMMLALAIGMIAGLLALSYMVIRWLENIG